MELVMRLRNSDFGLRIKGKNGVVPLRFDLNRQLISGTCTDAKPANIYLFKK